MVPIAVPASGEKSPVASRNNSLSLNDQTRRQKSGTLPRSGSSKKSSPNERQSAVSPPKAGVKGRPQSERSQHAERSGPPPNGNHSPPHSEAAAVEDKACIHQHHSQDRHSPEGKAVYSRGSPKGETDGHKEASGDPLAQKGDLGDRAASLALPVPEETSASSAQNDGGAAVGDAAPECQDVSTDKQAEDARRCPL